MAREIDVRNFNRSRVTPERVNLMNSRAAEVSDRLPGTHRVRVEKFDEKTGNPAVVVSEAAPAGGSNYTQRALQHVQAISPVLGFATEHAPEFVADPVTQETSTGAKSVNLQQRYKGIPIFQAATMVRFHPNGALHDTSGDLFTVAQDVAVAPKLTVQEAVLKAAQHVAEPDPDEQGKVDQFGQPMTPPRVDISGFKPVVRAMFTNSPDKPTVLEPGPFGAEIKAKLIWFPLQDDIVLGWDVLLTMPSFEGQYETIVDASKGDILFCHQRVHTVAATGNVYRVDGGSTRQITTFPRPIHEYGLPFPTPGQSNWRWCNKCQGLFFAGNASQGSCKAGGAHDKTGSGDYSLVSNAPAYPGQSNWRWCNKCQGLFFAGNASQGVCPAGGAHDKTGSGNYSLLQQNPLAPGQHGWRWCNKCQGLYFSGNATQGVCPAGGAHDATGSGDYSLLFSASAGLPSGFPDDWVTSNQTIGNCTNAHLDAAGSAFTGTNSGGTLTFNPNDATGDDQKVLNIFYYCCYMHDFSYLLGFRESDGNFQQDDFGRGGVGGDSVNARSFSGAVWGTANMSTPVDGSSPTMTMGLVTSTNRHTAFDSTVVFHEFTHGISTRLVGGPMNSNSLDDPQSGGMNEGWSDYFACTINNVVVLGNWVLNNTGGIRGFPYDSNFPDHFGMLGTGRYSADPKSGQPNDPHNVGEIWCAALMEMNRRTNRHFAIQLVMDAYKLTAVNPSFLDGRDAILLALNHMLTSGRINAQQRDGAWQGIWGAFARFGMGPQAASNGAQLNGITADFTIGQDNWRWCNKCQGLFFAGNASQGVCPAGGAHDKSGSWNYDLVMNWSAAPGQSNWRWCNKCQGLFFAGNASQGSCKAGGAHDKTGSGDYKLIFNAWGGPAQSNWRWCHKCQGLFFAGNASQGVCPAGAAHDKTGSGDYHIMSR